MVSTERARRRYRPIDVRVLFIGESPPDGGRFFYFGDSILHNATRDAFVAGWPTLRHEEDFLGAFQRLGCYLEDLSTTPVNKLAEDEAEGLLCAGIPKLVRRIKPLQPKAVVIVKSSIVPKATHALKGAGHGAVERHELPFPIYHRNRYISELSALVRRWRKRGVLPPLLTDD